MTTPTPAPIAHIRVIAATGHAQTLIADITARAKALLGDDATYRVHSRPARRAGHTRAYLTVTSVKYELSTVDEE